MDFDVLLKNISIFAIPVLFAVALHEVAHGWVAKLFGDRTAELLGRLSLNPLKHVDSIGTLLVPSLLLALRLPIFGWGRPVPVATAGLKHPRRASIAVAAAGPLANLIMALIWSAVLAGAVRVHLQGEHTLVFWVILMAQAGIVTNVILGYFHLIPIPPLDAGRMVIGLLPNRVSTALQKFEPFGLLLVLALAASQQFGFGWMFKPAYSAVNFLIDSVWVGPPRL